ncbi:MAG: glycosyltransferase [Thermogutta sp.]|uniref:glycosyltransferase family 2 protein n=1 Tax=Thermogutta sp. TaxID=1962930 RepID=UPI00199656B8|nr:glycosyltransferase [Thermogutta sp.]MBC7350807.1 glycosyltransferase [Thermogutta sp.]
MAEPLVSVVIPVHNGERYLETTIQSVLNQTYTRLEIIVVNDGSTDGSRNVLRKYKDRIQLFEQPQLGVGAARNRGVLEARGELVAFLDQDDWWFPTKIEKEVDELFRSDSGLVHTNTLYFDDSTQTFCDPLDPLAKPEEYIGWCYDRLLLGNAICNSSVVVRRVLFAQVGLCDYRIEGNSVQDYDLWLRLAQVTPFGFVEEPLTVFRLHPGQGTNNRRLMLREQIKILQWRLPTSDRERRRKLRKRLAGLADLLGRFELDFQDHTAARKAFWMALMFRPSIRALCLLCITYLSPGCVTYIRNIYGRLKGRH